MMSTIAVCVPVYRRATAADRAAEMPRLQTGQSRGTTGRPARLLPATLRGGARVLAQHGQTRPPGGRQAQDRTTQV